MDGDGQVMPDGLTVKLQVLLWPPLVDIVTVFCPAMEQLALIGEPEVEDVVQALSKPDHVYEPVPPEAVKEVFSPSATLVGLAEQETVPGGFIWTEQAPVLPPLVTVKFLAPVVEKLAVMGEPLVELKVAPALGETDQE